MKILKGLAPIVLVFLAAFLPRHGNTPAGENPKPTELSSSKALSGNLFTPDDSVTPTLDPGEPPPARAESEFKTDFSKHSVPYSEILFGGPPKDGIPALNEPQFVSVSEADAWLKPAKQVIQVQVGDDARAYPIQILIWHEIANDTVGNEPLAVTFVRCATLLSRSSALLTARCLILARSAACITAT
jgi:hypothetical protein